MDIEASACVLNSRYAIAMLCYIHRVDWNKLTKGRKIPGKVAMGVVIMQGVPKIFGALRGHLYDSIAFLLLVTNECIYKSS